ncbi:hypothetical protein [uncultured Clostridium sp.]|nr:hypothetical protein [uncultured Clostridium sp.]
MKLFKNSTLKKSENLLQVIKALYANKNFYNEIVIEVFYLL